MIKSTGNYRESQVERLQAKTQDQQLINRVVVGTGMSPWEAKVLVQETRDVYFSTPESHPMRSGQLLYSCIASHEGAGKPLKECQMVSVRLTLHSADDSPGYGKPGYCGNMTDLRRQKILRMTEEARDQGGLLTQEDLGSILCCDDRTIRRDIKALRAQEIIVGTRGTIKDIGPGVTHRELAIRKWLEGQEPVDVARDINHSLNAVERYLQHFSRTVFLRRKKFAKLQISLTLGCSSASTGVYLELYEKYHRKRKYKQRFEEIDIIGSAHYEAEDEKKGILLPEKNTKNVWRVS